MNRCGRVFFNFLVKCSHSELREEFLMLKRSTWRDPAAVMSPSPREDMERDPLARGLSIGRYAYASWVSQILGLRLCCSCAELDMDIDRLGAWRRLLQATFSGTIE
ncbi:hypothetical protein ACMFMG_003571 [Clarireedia jacksonii]